MAVAHRMRAHARPSPWARARGEYAGWAALLLVLSAGVGLAAGIKPSDGVALAIGIAFSLVTISDVTAGLVLFTILSFIDVFSSSTGSASFIKVAGLLLFGSWYAQRLVGTARARAAVARIPTNLVVSVVALALWSALSVTWAESSGVAITSTLSFVLNMLLLPITMVAVRRREHLHWVLAAFLIGAVISTAYGFISPLSQGRVEGGIGDANEQAAVLVAAIPIALALGNAMRRPALRLLCWGGGVFCLIGVFTTLSRGGLIALGCVTVGAVAFGGRWRGKAAALLAVTVLGTVTYYFALAPLAARQRVTSATTSGRSDIWRVGWRMVEAHPWIGSGSGNFQEAAIHYVQGIGSITSANLIVNVPHVAHNIYLELLADLGIPGLLAFLGVAGFSALAVAKAARRFEQQGDREMELVARCLLLSVVAFMSADFFLSGEFSKQLWLTFALCPAVLALSGAGRSAEAASAEAPPPRARDTAYQPQHAY
jgi:putative inorganic carbon (HCO3(-)) transporter